jgi:hypothetical protein
MDISVELLPKIYLAVIPKYWYYPIPSDIPESSSTFSLKYDKDSEYDAVKEMEANLNTEDSIVTPEDIPENDTLSQYLGTYNVVGTPGELTLLNPNKIGNKDEGAVAYHYIDGEEGETGVWEKIEDAQIIDGYVWGTVNSFSPIAVFTVKPDTYFSENAPYMGGPAFVANGIPIVVSLNDKNKTIVTDAYGKVTEIPATTMIIGGSYDRDLESINVTVKGDVKFRGIRAGSIRDGAEETPLRVGKITVNIEGVNRPSVGVTGSYGAVKTEEVEINIKDSKLGFCGAGESICNGNDANKEWGQKCSLASKAWVKKARITLDNSYVNCAYAGCNCGYMYGDDVEIIAKNGSSAEWYLACGSNGATNKAKATAIDSEIVYMQTTNRGPVNSSELVVKNSTVEYLFPTGDSTDKSVNGTVAKSRVEVTNGKVNLYPGTNNGVVITKEDANQIIDVIKISRTTDLTYKEDADKILEDKIVIK